MSSKSTFTPKASLTEAPTNLKEAIDWVLRVTGRDGKKLDENKGECICGLAAAVTDLLQSVQLEYHGYQGEGADTSKGATKDEVTNHLNGLFSLVQGLGGTAVVRTYIDQLAQVLSALVGWSSIEKCWGKKGGSDKCEGSGGNKERHGKDSSCKYLLDVEDNKPCDKCGCMKWKDPEPSSNEGHHLGRRCTKCSDGGGSSTCKCSGTSGGNTCPCAKNMYLSAYKGALVNALYWTEVVTLEKPPTWNYLKYSPLDGSSPSQRRHHCARILLGSVCLIWSGITYMYWTGKYHKSSPRWNNHILDGSGLDDGTLSQWLQALGFPREMLNDSGPGNRWDAIIWDGLLGKLFLGFTHPSGSGANDGNTAKQPTLMNYPGFIHTIHRDSFNNEATVFRNGTSSAGQVSDTNQHKRGALFKLYILSCAYFTGLQKKTPPKAGNTTPKTIREILYWLSALPYSQAYKGLLDYAKKRLAEVLKKPGETPSNSDETQLKFHQQGRNAPITVDQYNLFAHFQAVTQYCPLVLIGIQGGLGKSTDTTTPAIHSLYANTECSFTYPTVSIQAYNQVVHYIRALFYQLYFLRKQCAVKVALGGKWRECRYGHGVESKGVISWMCLGCDPMEHDRKCRVDKVKGELDGVMKKVKALEGEKTEGIKEVKDVLVTIGNVVVQLGNAQEALEGKDKEAINAVKEALEKAKEALGTAKQELDKVKDEEKLEEDELEKLKEATKKLDELTGKLGTAAEKDGKEVDPGKNKISEAIHGLRYVVEALNKLAKQNEKNVECHVKGPYNNILMAIDHLQEICNSPKCHNCKDHFTKCGQQPKPTICPTCHQQYMDGKPSPLQAFLEDRLPGFSCEVVRSDESAQPQYPLAASHLGHCNGSGQCCPLPMGFRGQFQKGSITDMTGQRLYGILYFFSNGDMMQSCVYTLVRVTAALSATTPQVLGDVFGFFRGGIGEKESGKTQKGQDNTPCNHDEDPSKSENKDKYFCGWCASGLRDVVKQIEWIPNSDKAPYRETVGTALVDIKGDKGEIVALKGSTQNNTTSLSTLTKDSEYLSPLTGELYTAVSATFGNTYLSWVLYLSDALHSGLESLASAFQQIECNACKGQCDPNKCRKGEHGRTTGDTKGTPLCNCSSIVSCTGVLPVLYRHGFSYGNPFNLEGYQQNDTDKGDYSIDNKQNPRQCHEFLSSLGAVIDKNKQDQATSQEHPLTELLKQVGKLQYDIRLPWIFVLTLAWLVAVLYLAFGAIWPLDWTHMRSHWLRGGAHQWQCMWYKVMTGRKGVDLMEYFGRR
ncbi:variant erythrocyte surface antigen-1 alpha subunit [Babesia bovis T2Bo]|uniref:Variant erythrocyte surface antigen-1, alpha subunit n=1 Tax=Babesia bovis TaxID=5865 RepID=A7AM54_BABBO|nr:variant erythrocyte surface antigen-1 alpha subunit [Babesia bovis T2Bo]EDO07638.1 variant erythrocyte surface antigen-1 alpha subunit [Babesia bovis T2Bo]|eukprot:XP_001611206.1 variant erythrocyte surface antigen-1, alpha subunit [Babesia bovis T2Bo]